MAQGLLRVRLSVLFVIKCCAAIMMRSVVVLARTARPRLLAYVLHAAPCGVLRGQRHSAKNERAYLILDGLATRPRFSQREHYVQGVALVAILL